jgi:hypothetical protein
MSEYYIQTSDNVLYSLDSTTGMTYVISGRPTSFPVESGASLADHYVNRNVVLSLTGVITDVKSLSTSTDNNRPTEEFIEQLKTIKESGQPFTVFVGSKLQELKNCVFTNMNISQGDTNGVRKYSEGNVFASYSINMSFEQIRLAQQAQETELVIPAPAPEIADDSAEKKETGKGTKEVVDATGNLSESTKRALTTRL